MLESDKAAAELAHWQFAHEWYKGLGLEVIGIEIGDALTYDILAMTGRAYFAVIANDQQQQQTVSPD